MAIAIRPIKTAADYEVALKRIDELMEADNGTPEADDLEVWATLADPREKAVNEALRMLMNIANR